MITFFFTFNDIGGVQVLIFNMIKELFKYNIRTKLIYHKDSWLTNELDKYDIKYEFFNIKDIKTKKLDEFIEKDDIICTTILFTELAYFRKKNPSFLLWNVFPSTCDFVKKNFASIRKLTRKNLIKKMVEKNGLVFMDNEGVEFINVQFGIKISPVFLPVPVNIHDKNKFLIRRNNYKNKDINITFLGRAIKWKVNPVIKVINVLNNLINERIKIVLHIITDNVESFKKLMNGTSPNFEIKFYSGLSGEKLSNFLYTTSDLHIAAGTSCIEGSSLGIPSILVDASNRDFPEDYLFRWIFENENFCLGKMLKDFRNIPTGRTFSEILSYYNENNFEILSSISEKCYEYTKQNHDLQKIAKAFYASCINSKLRIRDVVNTDLSFYLKTRLRDRIYRFKSNFQVRNKEN